MIIMGHRGLCRILVLVLLEEVRLLLGLAIRVVP